MNLIQQLNWRYSTKRFQEKEIPVNDLHDILEAFRLAPSAFGLQPGRIFLIENPKIREELSHATLDGNKSRVLWAPVLLVLAGNTRLNEADIDEFMENTATTTHTSIDELKGRGDFLKWYFGSFSPEQKLAYATNSVMLGLGFLLSAAAMKGVDAGPMAIIDTQKYDEILWLKDLGLQSIFSVALGYRDESDMFASIPKVRLPFEKVVTKI